MRMRTVTRSVAALAVAAAVPLTVSAQPIVPPAPELSNAVTDVPNWRVEAGASVEHHSNINGLPDGADPQALYGKSKRSDSVLRGALSVNYDRQFSLQHLTAAVELTPAKYFTYSQFDYFGYGGRMNLDWAIGSNIYGTAGFRATQALTSVLSNQQIGSRNLERRNTLYGSAGYRITPAISAFVGADTTKLTNSTEYFSGADYTVDGVEGGMRYAPGTGTELSLAYRHTRGDYPNNQQFDALGNVLANPVNNSYKQNEGLLRMAVQPSDQTRLSGQVGYARREYDTLAGRDYSGPTALLNLEWRPAGAFYMNVELARDISSVIYLSQSYVQVTELRFRPVYVLTGKISLNGRFVYSKQEYKGDAGFQESTGPVRSDNIYELGGQVRYEYSRALLFTADLRQLRRTSNYSGFAFRDNVIGVGVLSRF